MSALLLALLLQTAPAHPPAETAPAEPAHATEATATHAPEGEAGAAHAADPATVIMHHVIDVPLAIGLPGREPWVVLPSKHTAFLLGAVLLVIVGARLAMRSYGEKGVPRGIGAAVEGLVLFVRDKIAEPNIGHDGRKFTPLLCSFFSFILVAALLGLMPFAATSTGNLAVTLALATISFIAQQYAGISKYGVVGHFRNLIPPGLPAWLLPIMIPVEILSMFTKPFALMIRLFANMLAGHMVITTLILLISLMGQISWLGGVAMTPVSVGLALFIMLLEILVAFIQAYIFTLLSAIFIGMYAHPAH
jgi:F-type H+-transporting ATPase subunit a